MKIIQKKRVLENIANRRFFRRLKSKRKSKENKLSPSYSINKNRKPSEYDVIKFPKNVDIYNTDNARTLLKIISEAEEAYITGSKKPFILSFYDTKTITLSGGIILKAFYEKLKFNKCEMKIKILDGNKKIRQILKHIKILENESIKITHDNIKCWDIRHWKREDRKRSNATSELSGVLTELTEWSSKSDEHKYTLTALPEAIWNSFEHAYYGYADYEFQHTFLFSGVLENNYTFCIFDRGMGFKGSFQRYHPEFFKLLKSETEFIKEALKYGRSNAKGRSRGSGLPDVIDSITRSLGGSVSIYSNKASYRKNLGGEESEDRPDLHGALVQISVPVKKG